MRIFISYAHIDTYLVRDYLVDFLTKAFYEPWFDHNLVPGMDWQEQLLDSIRKCNCFIYALTPESVKSASCRWEYEQATLLKKPVLPVLLRDMRDEDIPETIRKIQYVKFTDGPTKDALALLSRGLRNVENNLPRGEVATSKPQTRTLQFKLPLLKWIKIPLGTITPEQSQKFITAFQTSGYPFEDGEYRTSIDTIKINKSSLEVTIDSFLIAKYPVTNFQFQAFIYDREGYSNPQWWPPISRKWHEKNPLPVSSTFRGDNQPREMVNWFEAIAFCTWLGHKTGLFISIPTLPERIRAAVGDDNWIYPWGNQFDSKKCNTKENLFKTTTHVDNYPNGLSPFGVADLSGNIWEWSYPYRISKDARIKQFAYGGGWRGRRRHARVAYPRIFSPTFRSPDLGFRLCVYGHQMSLADIEFIE